MTTKGLSERRALAAAGMSASALRYSPRPDRNVALRQKIIDLAHRHRRYGVGMIHLKLGQAGEKANYKRVERLYREAHLQVRRRKRKKVPLGERQPLERPTQANAVWSMDFVFDRTADSRVIKCLTIVDDATQEAFATDLDMGQSYYGAVAREQRNMTLWNLFRIAEALGTTAAQPLRAAGRPALAAAKIPIAGVAAFARPCGCRSPRGRRRSRTIRAWPNPCRSPTSC